MRAFRLSALLLCLALIGFSSLGQQTSTSPASGPQTPQAASIIQKSIAAMTGGATATDVTATGTISVARSGNFGISVTTAGQSTRESGTITLVATASGQGQSTTATTAGTSVNVQDISQGTPLLNVTGAGGNSYTIQTASALTPHPSWFWPAMVLQTALSSPSYAAAYIGHETWQGAAVEHIAIWRTNGSASAMSTALQEASQHDIFLDSTSFLPVGMTYVVHPYNPSNPTKPIIPYRGNSPDRVSTVLFSDWRQVQGFEVPFHIQSAMTVVRTDATADLGSEIQLSSVTFNTGVTIPSLTAN
jgi:hypothetical protein